MSKLFWLGVALVLIPFMGVIGYGAYVMAGIWGVLFVLSMMTGIILMAVAEG
jgi:hypothetical protein